MVIDGAAQGYTPPTGTILGTDPDVALRGALMAAVGAGDLALAEQLLRLLRAREAPPAGIVELVAAGRGGRK